MAERACQGEQPFRTVAAEHRVSIHQVAAQVQNLPACNGWQFWYARVEGRPVPIDWFRQKLRAEIN